MAETSLHRAVADLSHVAGTPLIERRARGLNLTRRGSAFARDLRLALTELRAGLAEANAVRGRETGRIAIGAMPLARARILPDAIAAFHASAPQVGVAIIEGSHDELIGPLRDGEIDMMIGALRDLGPAGDLIDRPLFEDRPMIFARPDHPLAGRPEPSIEELANFPWIVAAEGTPLRTLWRSMFDDWSVAVPPVPIECGAVITIRQLLLRGDFLTLLSPDQLTIELQTGALARIGKAPDHVVRTIGLTTRADWRPTAANAFPGDADGATDFVRIATGKAGHHEWPRSIPVRPSVPPKRVEGTELRVTWIGHATTLVQTQGLNILIDPVWAWRDSPIQLVGPKRVRAPGVRLSDLPPIDIVLISHNHHDHLDIGTLKFLARRDDPRIIVGLGNDKLLAEHGLKSIAGDWGQHVELRPGLDVEIMRAHHWSAHWIDDIDRALWVGFRIALPGGDIYYAGDTGVGEMQWARAAIRPRPIRLAILPIAPYKAGSSETGNHIDPDEAVTAFGLLEPAYALGVYWGTFELGNETVDGAPVRLAAGLKRGGIATDRFRTLDAGASWSIPTLTEQSGN